MARKRTLAAALATVGYLQVAPAWSLGLGEINLESFLNEPLRARVNLLNTGDLHEDQIRIRLATSEDFDRLGVERAYFLTGIKFEVQLDDQGSGAILLTSEDPVLEPYLDFIIEARWPAGRLLRNYTVLVDPPGRLPESHTVSAREQVTSDEEAAAERAPQTDETATTRASGDRVDLDRSDLAPGEMPQRSYSTGAADSPVSGGRYLIRRDETLWSIAQRARPEGVSVQQTMLEIQRLNPDAFIDGNINRIKAGYIIYLPDSGDMSPADIDTVREQVRQQNADWRAGRPSTPAEPQPALRIASDSGDGGEDNATAQASDSAAGRTETAEESQAAAADQAPAVADSTPTATREDLERAEQERDDLSRQLASLNDRLASLERMVQVRDAEIAELQAALADAQASTATPEAPAAAPEEPTVAESEPRTPAPRADADGDGSAWWYGLGAALLVALGGLFLWRRRQAEDEDQYAAAPGPAPAGDEFSRVELRDQAVELDVADEGEGSPVMPAPPTSPQRGYGERKHDQYAADVEASDALAEADIYIAYGRFTQAAELLRKAIMAEPDNSAFRLRLMELAVETGDREEAEQQLAELHRIGDAASIEAAENLFLGGAVFAHSASDGETPASDDSDLAGDPLDRVAEDMPASTPEPTPASAEPTTAGSDEEFSGHLSDFGQVEPVEDLSDDLPDLSAGMGSTPADDTVPGDAVANDAFGDDDEPEFLGLEIEEPVGEELDLSQEPTGKGQVSDEDDFVFADDGDPMATKLDLARAYIDMGDAEGAREILNEVVSEGSGEQQQDARELLDRLG